jgi:hypothetical protein
MSQCPKCAEWVSSDRHVCSPEYEIRGGDYSDEWKKIHAPDPGTAVERWAERDDAGSAEYRIASGKSAKVYVCDPNGNVTRWTVSGERVPQYSASMIVERP